MFYHACENVYWCTVAERVVFLDLMADRYFMLPESLERDFVAGGGGKPLLEALRKRLEGVEVWNNSSPSHGHVGIETMPALRSAIEDVDTGSPASAASYFRASLTVARMWLSLRTKPLLSVLTRVADLRDRKAASSQWNRSVASEERTLLVTTAFLRARQRIPIRTSCLLDSLSLVDYLSRHGISARIVFGVSLNPFAAHCWAQVGDLALNETVMGTTQHSTILVW